MMALICTEMGWVEEENIFTITLIAETVADIPKLLVKDIFDAKPMTLLRAQPLPAPPAATEKGLV